MFNFLPVYDDNLMLLNLEETCVECGIASVGSYMYDDDPICKGDIIHDILLILAYLINSS